LRFLTLRWALAVWPALKSFSDLNEDCEHGAEEHGGKTVAFAKGAYHSRLSHVLTNELRGLVFAAAQKAFVAFPFGHREAMTQSADSGGDFELLRDKDLLEMALLFELGEPGSMLSNAGVIVRPKITEKWHSRDLEFLKNLRDPANKLRPNDFYGIAVISADLNLISPHFSPKSADAADAENQFNDAFIGLVEGAQIGNRSAGEAVAIEKKGHAETAVRTKRVKDLAGVGASSTAALMSDRVTDVKVASIGQPIIDALENTFGKK